MSAENRKKVVAAFNRFDEDGDGTISRDELKMLMEKLGDLSEDELDGMISSVDKNGDGSISFEEFVEWAFGEDGSAQEHELKSLVLNAHRVPKLNYVHWSKEIPVPEQYRERGCHVPDTHRRAMTLSQLMDLGSLVQEVLNTLEIVDPSPYHSVGRISWSNVNLYHMNDIFVIPLTSAFLCAFYELVGEGPQDPKWFISHWWGTPFIETLDVLRYHAYVRELSDSSPYWMCTFANNQHCLEELCASDLRETPFVRAIMAPSCEGTVMIMDKDATPFCRTWCTLENYISTTDGRKKPESFLLDIGAVIKSGSQRCGAGVFDLNTEDIPAMLMDDASGNWVDSVGDDSLGLQFPPSVARAGIQTDIAAASASNVSDKHNILRCIIGDGSSSDERIPPATDPAYDRVNAAIRKIFGPRALFAAAYSCNAEEANRLLKAGSASVHDEDQTGRTALIIATQNLSGEPDESRRVPLVRVLLEARADPKHCTTRLGICAMHTAAYWNLAETLRVLIAAGGDVNLPRTCDGQLPIHEAIGNDSVDAVELLAQLMNE